MNKEPWLHSSEVILTHDEDAVHPIDIEQGASSAEEIVVHIDACEPCGAVDIVTEAIEAETPRLEHGPVLDACPIAPQQRNLYMDYASEIVNRVAGFLKGLPMAVKDQVVAHPLRSAAFTGLVLYAWMRPPLASDDRADKRLLVQDDFPACGLQQGPGMLDSAKSAAGTVADKTSGMMGAARDAIASAAGTVAEKTSGLLGAAKDGLMSAAGTVADKTSSALGAARDGLASAAGTVADKTGDALSAAREGIAGAAAAASDHASAMMGAAKDKLAGTAAAASDTAADVSETSKSLVSSAAEKVGNAMSAMKSQIAGAVSATARQASRAGAQVASTATSTARVVGAKSAQTLRQLPPLMAQEPLYMCLACLGAGAVAGLLIPVSDQEMTLLAPARETVVEAAREEIDEVVNTVRQALAPESSSHESSSSAAQQPMAQTTHTGTGGSFETLETEFPAAHSSVLDADLAAPHTPALADAESIAQQPGVDLAAQTMTGLPAEQPETALPRMSIHDQPFTENEPIGDLNLRNDFHGEDHPF